MTVCLLKSEQLVRYTVEDKSTDAPEIEKCKKDI